MVDVVLLITTTGFGKNHCPVPFGQLMHVSAIRLEEMRPLEHIRWISESDHAVVEKDNLIETFRGEIKVVRGDKDCCTCLPQLL
jgi:hypothetical protein